MYNQDKIFNIIYACTLHTRSQQAEGAVPESKFTPRSIILATVNHEERRRREKSCCSRTYDMDSSETNRIVYTDTIPTYRMEAEYG